jgi:hypothetical protein
VQNCTSRSINGLQLRRACVYRDIKNDGSLDALARFLSIADDIGQKQTFAAATLMSVEGQQPTSRRGRGET